MRRRSWAAREPLARIRIAKCGFGFPSNAPGRRLTVGLSEHPSRTPQRSLKSFSSLETGTSIISTIHPVETRADAPRAATSDVSTSSRRSSCRDEIQPRSHAFGEADQHHLDDSSFRDYGAYIHDSARRANNEGSTSSRRSSCRDDCRRRTSTAAPNRTKHHLDGSLSRLGPNDAVAHPPQEDQHYLDSSLSRLGVRISAGPMSIGGDRVFSRGEGAPTALTA
jgi:hypothetical protein